MLNLIEYDTAYDSVVAINAIRAHYSQNEASATNSNLRIHTLAAPIRNEKELDEFRVDCQSVNTDSVALSYEYWSHLPLEILRQSLANCVEQLRLLIVSQAQLIYGRP